MQPHGRTSIAAGAALAAAVSCGWLVLDAPSANALTLLQSFTDTVIVDPIPFGANTTYGPPSTFTVQPFPASIGTLISTTITWATSGVGLATASSNGGALSLSNGGGTMVNLSTYGGYGTGAGDGAGPNQFFTVTLPASGLTTLFEDPSVGVSYDPIIWTAFTGLTPFSIRYQNPSIPGPYSITYTTVSGRASITTNASVMYNYTPVPGPLALLGAPAAWSWCRLLRQRRFQQHR